MNKGLSTLTEIIARGNIYQVVPSVLREDTFIVIFAMGDQANIDRETYQKLFVETLLKAA